MLNKNLLCLEFYCYLVGAVLLSGTLMARAVEYVDNSVQVAQLKNQFDLSRTRVATSLAATSVANPKNLLAKTPEFSHWSSQRIKDFHQTLSLRRDKPVALLTIPVLALEVSVYDEANASNLNRGVGRIVGTDSLSAPGNVGIAGHRDSFFCGLKDVKLGDQILLRNADKQRAYSVVRIDIVQWRMTL
jgi:sortase (surface protein transpeptidase)